VLQIVTTYEKSTARTTRSVKKQEI